MRGEAIVICEPCCVRLEPFQKAKLRRVTYSVAKLQTKKGLDTKRIQGQVALATIEPIGKKGLCVNGSWTVDIVS